MADRHSILPLFPELQTATASVILLVSSVPVYIARNYSGLAYNNRRMGKTCVYLASKVAEEDFFLSLSLWHGTVSTCSFARAVLNNP